MGLKQCFFSYRQTLHSKLNIQSLLLQEAVKFLQTFLFYLMKNIRVFWSVKLSNEMRKSDILTLIIKNNLKFIFLEVEILDF